LRRICLVDAVWPEVITRPHPRPIDQ
jgi:hypothetical protein